MHKYTCYLLLISCFLLIGCSTPNPGKTLDEIKQGSDSTINKSAQGAKDLANKAIDLGTANMDGAKKEIGIAAGDKAKEIINEQIDAGAEKAKTVASGTFAKIGDTVNKANDSVKSSIDTAKQTTDKAIDTAKNTVDQAKSVVAGGYTSYSQTAVDTALKAGKSVVLFFHASWCPSCKSLDQDILTKKANIPSDTVIFKVDYDLSVDLKKKYGVTSQHTLVYLNSDASKKSLVRGSKDLETVLSGK